MPEFNETVHAVNFFVINIVVLRYSRLYLLKDWKNVYKSVIDSQFSAGALKYVKMSFFIINMILKKIIGCMDTFFNVSSS